MLTVKQNYKIPGVVFPSPCGDCGSYQGQKVGDDLPCLCCFRPLAGIVVLIQGQKAGDSLPCLCFRPLAGIVVLISACANMLLIFSKSVVSVPLRGLWFLSSLDNSCTGAERLVSVPLRGLWFLSQAVSFLSLTSARSFRPLAGIVVLIFYHRKGYLS